MTDDGYLQIKIRELKEQINELSLQISTYKELIDRKTAEGNLIIEKINHDIIEARNILNREEQKDKILKSALTDIQTFHTNHYAHMLKTLQKEGLHHFEDMRKKLNYTINEHLVGYSLLANLLIKKGIIDSSEYLKDINDDWDLAVAKVNEEETPIKAATINIINKSELGTFKLDRSAMKSIFNNLKWEEGSEGGKNG